MPNTDDWVTEEASTEGVSVTLSQFVANLPVPLKQELLDFVSYQARALVDIQHYFFEKYELECSLDEVAQWSQEELPTDVAVSQINLETSRYKGINEISELEYQLAKLHDRIEHVLSVIQQYEGIELTDANLEEQKRRESNLKATGGMNLAAAYKVYPGLIREQNNLIAQLNKVRFISNRTELILYGADYVIRYLESEARKLPQGEEIVNNLCRGAWASVSQEVEHH